MIVVQASEWLTAEIIGAQASGLALTNPINTFCTSSMTESKSGPVLSENRTHNSRKILTPPFSFYYKNQKCKNHFTTSVHFIILAFLTTVGIKPTTLCLECRHANHFNKSPVCWASSCSPDDVTSCSPEVNSCSPDDVTGRYENF